MPRIAAAVAAFALMAFSIGFNVSRYPMVWKMVGGSPHPSQSSESSQSVAAEQPAAAAESTASWQSTPIEPVSGDPAIVDKAVVDKAAVDRAAVDRVAVDKAVLDTGDTGNQGQDYQSWAVGCSESAAATELEDAYALASNARLVPVVRPPAAEIPAEEPSFDDAVRRLPPVDQVSPSPFIASSHASHLSEDPIPIYPTTGR